MLAAKSSEWRSLEYQLESGGVSGASELGRFVNDTTYLAPSRFDERAAMPILLAALPHLQDSSLVAAVGAHLNRAWARPAAYQAVYDAFVHWAPIADDAGWQLGDCLGTVAERENLKQLTDLVLSKKFGISRQMIVLSLWRFRSAPETAAVLRQLARDDQVALQAISALKRTVPREELQTELQSLIDSDVTPHVRGIAAKQLRLLAKLDTKRVR
jgi:hypothetical protein